MTLAGWVELIALVLKFPSAVLQLVRVLEKTPAEKHQEIIVQVNEWTKKSSESDRPTWEHP